MEFDIPDVEAKSSSTDDYFSLWLEQLKYQIALFRSAYPDATDNAFSLWLKQVTEHPTIRQVFASTDDDSFLLWLNIDSATFKSLFRDHLDYYQKTMLRLKLQKYVKVLQ